MQKDKINNGSQYSERSFCFRKITGNYKTPLLQQLLATKLMDPINETGLIKVD
jgi:hypothetical protein